MPCSSKREVDIRPRRDRHAAARPPSPDAFPLLAKVDGVVIVGRIGRSRRDAAEELQKVLVGSGVHLLGVIANCAKASGLSSYARPADSGTPPAAASPDDTSSSEAFIPIAKA